MLTPSVVSPSSFISRTHLGSELFHKTESRLPNYPTLQHHKISDIRILFGKVPDGWDVWDYWEGWDSWDQQINRKLEAQSSKVICHCYEKNIFFKSVVSLPYQNSVPYHGTFKFFPVYQNLCYIYLNWEDEEVQTAIQPIYHNYRQDYFGIIKYNAFNPFSIWLLLFIKFSVLDRLNTYNSCI